MGIQSSAASQAGNYTIALDTCRSRQVERTMNLNEFGDDFLHPRQGECFFITVCVQTQDLQILSIQHLPPTQSITHLGTIFNNIASHTALQPPRIAFKFRRVLRKPQEAMVARLNEVTITRHAQQRTVDQEDKFPCFDGVGGEETSTFV